MDTKRFDAVAKLVASRVSRRRFLATSAATGAGLAAGRPMLANAQTPTSGETREMPDDWEGMVDIGGRLLHMETRGSGGPTVVLLTGYRASGMYWTNDLLQPDEPRTMVMPAVAEFTHVVTYDRPGTFAPDGPEDVFVGRSDAMAQPRTVTEMVEELHDLLQAAGVPGPYVLAGHSLGGFLGRLYASTYPDEVVGLVLVDAYSEVLATLLGPERNERLTLLNQALGTDTIIPIPGYGDVETTPYGGGDEVMTEAAADSPLRPMPLAVLAHGLSFPLPAEAEGFTSEELEPILRAGNEAQATLVPNARFIVAADSGHDVHQDQPQLVIEAIRQVVAGVRDPATWDTLTTCCTG